MGIVRDKSSRLILSLIFIFSSLNINFSKPISSSTVEVITNSLGAGICCMIAEYAYWNILYDVDLERFFECDFDETVLHAVAVASVAGLATWFFNKN